MSTATLFSDGEGQAVRLPNDMRFDGVAEVAVERQGKSLVLTPQRKPKRQGKYAHLPLGDALAAIARDSGVTDDDIDHLERNIAEHRMYCNRHYKPVAFE